MTVPIATYTAAYFRGLVIAALQGGVTAGILAAPILSPGDWDTPEANLPVIKVRHGNQRKECPNAPAALGPVTFQSQVTVEILAQCRSPNPVSAQTAIELMGAGIEQALFGQIFALDIAYCVANNIPGRIVGRIAASEQRIDITAEARVHLAELQMSVTAEILEVFQPTGIPLTEIQGTLTDPDTGVILAQFDLVGLT